MPKISKKGDKPIEEREDCLIFISDRPVFSYQVNTLDFLSTPVSSGKMLDSQNLVDLSPIFSSFFCHMSP